jgi:hypothetical protein
LFLRLILPLAFSRMLGYTLYMLAKFTRRGKRKLGGFGGLGQLFQSLLFCPLFTKSTGYIMLKIIGSELTSVGTIYLP